MIIGVDLGVRSIHVSTPSECFSIATDRSEFRWIELSDLADQFFSELDDDDIIYMEEPIAAGVKNLRTFLFIAQVSGVVLSSGGQVFPVPVTKWKQVVVGHGHASKDSVAEWLAANNPYDEVLEDQNHVDATCIRLYGEAVHHDGN